MSMKPGESTNPSQSMTSFASSLILPIFAILPSFTARSALYQGEFVPSTILAFLNKISYIVILLCFVFLLIIVCGRYKCGMNGLIKQGTTPPPFFEWSPSPCTGEARARPYCHSERSEESFRPTDYILVSARLECHQQEQKQHV